MTCLRTVKRNEGTAVRRTLVLYLVARKLLALLDRGLGG